MQNNHTALWPGGGGGRLSYIKHSVVGLLCLLEVNFRSKLSCGQCYSGQFVKDCLNDRALVTTFYQICYDMQTDEESEESVFEGMLKLFFKIRIHNRCKIFMDEYRNKKQVPQKQKSLRMNLKKSGENSNQKQTWLAIKTSKHSSFFRLINPWFCAAWPSPLHLTSLFFCCLKKFIFYCFLAFFFF